MRTSLRLVDLSSQSRIVRLESTVVASGADGAIYRIEDNPALVAKLYHEPGKAPERLTKLQTMLADPPHLPAIERHGRQYVQMAWPVAWLEGEEGDFLGYVMPAVDLSRATTLENLLTKKSRVAAGLPESYGFRLAAAANLAALVAELHARGHYIIDLKPVNLNVYADVFYMAVLDCDGFSVRGKEGERFPAHQFSDGYIGPEALQQALPPQALGEEQDRFALGVILFQLLNNGLHPFQGVPVPGSMVPRTNSERVQRDLYAYGRVENGILKPSPWSVHQFFDDETRTLFDRAFTTRDARPSAHEWHRHLEAYAAIDTGKARVCEKDRTHIHFAKGCQWCALENKSEGVNRSGRNRQRTRGGKKRETQVAASSKGGKRANRNFVAGGAKTGTQAPSPKPRKRSAAKSRLSASNILALALAALIFSPVVIAIFYSFYNTGGAATLSSVFENYDVEIGKDWRNTAIRSSPYIELVTKEPTARIWKVDVSVETGGAIIGRYARDRSSSEEGTRFRVPLHRSLAANFTGIVKAEYYFRPEGDDSSRTIKHKWVLHPWGEAEFMGENVSTKWEP